MLNMFLNACIAKYKECFFAIFVDSTVKFCYCVCINSYDIYFNYRSVRYYYGYCGYNSPFTTYKKEKQVA